MNDLDRGRIPARHPGGRTCGKVLPLALLLLPFALLLELASLFIPSMRRKP